MGPDSAHLGSYGPRFCPFRAVMALIWPLFGGSGPWFCPFWPIFLGGQVPDGAFLKSQGPDFAPYKEVRALFFWGGGSSFQSVKKGTPLRPPKKICPPPPQTDTPLPVKNDSPLRGKGHRFQTPCDYGATSRSAGWRDRKILKEKFFQLMLSLRRRKKIKRFPNLYKHL